MADRTNYYDLAVIGGGSGGIGAAVAAARAGVRVVFVEKEEIVGGTSTASGVSCWEPGVGGTGIPFDIYKRLKSIPDAVGIYSIGRHFCWQDDFYWPHALDKVNFPGGETLIDPGRTYVDSLRRHVPPGEVLNEKFQREFWHGVIFEPEAFSRVVLEMLRETGNCDVRLSTRLCDVTMTGGRLEAARLSDGSTVKANAWVDATGDGFLCTSCGCESLQGKDAKSRFDEPGAPEEGSERAVNGVTLIFRATPCAESGIESLPGTIPPDSWWAGSFPPVKCDHFPNGDLMINMLPTLSGEAYMGMTPDEAYAECTRRVRAQWCFMQTHFPEFRAYRLQHMSPVLGIRESRRIVCETPLTEHDLRAGLSSQLQPDIITIADHPCDRHGPGGDGCREWSQPYGIPYRCLIPKGFRNLLIASRGAGFSSIAASSCRLSRTMMQLGQAAGTAVAIARERKSDLPDVPATELRARLREQHVQLEWPTPPVLKAYLACE